MKTQQQLQDRCTPEIIKKMVELVELVEEAEKMYYDYCNISADDFEKKYDGSSVVAVLSRYHDALQALKKDHPEFEGKI